MQVEWTLGIQALEVSLGTSSQKLHSQKKVWKVKGKGKEEGESIVQEPVAAKDGISTNEVDNRNMSKAILIQLLSSFM